MPIEKDNDGRLQLGVADGRRSLFVLSIQTGPDHAGGLEVDGEDIKALVDAATTNVSSADAKASFIEALAISADYHADTNQQTLNTLTALAGTENQTVTDTRVNALKTALLAHMHDEASRTVRGSHLASDTANYNTLAAVADASDLATSITLINALLVAINTHATQAGVHFHNDATTVTITTDPPTTLAQVRTDSNDLLAAFKTHMAAGAGA